MRGRRWGPVGAQPTHPPTPRQATTDAAFAALDALFRLPPAAKGALSAKQSPLFRG